MGTSIKVIMNDGEIKDYAHEGRSGGSYTKEIKYEGSFAVIVDEYGNETAIPVQGIKEIKVSRSRHW